MFRSKKSSPCPPPDKKWRVEVERIDGAVFRSPERVESSPGPYTTVDRTFEYALYGADFPLLVQHNPMIFKMFSKRSIRAIRVIEIKEDGEHLYLKFQWDKDQDQGQEDE